MAIQVSAKSYASPAWAKSKSVIKGGIGRATLNTRSFKSTSSPELVKMSILWKDM